MKMVFLFEKEIRSKFNLEAVIPETALPSFTPYDFGPFAPNVFADLEFLVELGYVQPKHVGGPGENLLPEEAIEYEYWQASSGAVSEIPAREVEDEFNLTALGREFVKDGEAGVLTDEQWKTLDEFKARCTAASLRALLSYVYKKYPTMTTESKIRDEVLSDYPF